MKIEIQALVIELMVHDVERSIRFYTEAFGFEVTARFPESGVPTWAELVNGSTHIMVQGRPEMLQEMPGLAARTVGGTALLVFRVSSVQAVRKLYPMLEAKAKVIMPLRETDYGTVEFAVSDPDEYVLLVAGRNER